MSISLLFKFWRFTFLSNLTYIVYETNNQWYTFIPGTSPNQNFVKKPEVQDMGLSSSIDSSAAASASSSATQTATSYGMLIALISSLMGAVSH